MKKVRGKEKVVALPFHLDTLISIWPICHFVLYDHRTFGLAKLSLQLSSIDVTGRVYLPSLRVKVSQTTRRDDVMLQLSLFGQAGGVLRPNIQSQHHRLAQLMSVTVDPVAVVESIQLSLLVEGIGGHANALGKMASKYKAKWSSEKAASRSGFASLLHLLGLYIVNIVVVVGLASVVFFEATRHEHLSVSILI